jgi:hypothetical protein
MSSCGTAIQQIFKKCSQPSLANLKLQSSISDVTLESVPLDGLSLEDQDCEYGNAAIYDALPTHDVLKPILPESQFLG